MVGLLNGGLGAILMCSRGGSWWQMDETGFPVWMAALVSDFINMILFMQQHVSCRKERLDILIFFFSPPVCVVWYLLHFVGEVSQSMSGE